MTTLEFSYSLQKLSSSLKPFAMKLTRDVDDANDLLQDTMVKAFTNKDKFTEGTNLKAWLYTIMKNTFITNYQRMVRRGTFVDTTDNLHYINSSDALIDNGGFWQLHDGRHSACHPKVGRGIPYSLPHALSRIQIP